MKRDSCERKNKQFDILHDGAGLSATLGSIKFRLSRKLISIDIAFYFVY